MVDLSGSKYYRGSVYPVHCLESSGLFKRCEAMITPEKLISRYLLGVPMPDAFRDIEVLRDRIDMAINETETILKTTINREQFVQKLPYDSSLYRSFIYTKCQHTPILSVESLNITSSDNQQIYSVPAQWIEVAHGFTGQINVIPLLSTYGATQSGNVMQNAGLVFIATLGQLGWLPAFWEITYTSGLSFKEGQVPLPVNAIIGCTAAIDILSNLASLNTHNSVSIGQDGISQSSSSPGPQVYAQRIQDLDEKRQKMLKEIKGMYGKSIVMSNI